MFLPRGVYVHNVVTLANEWVGRMKPTKMGQSFMSFLKRKCKNYVSFFE